MGVGWSPVALAASSSFPQVLQEWAGPRPFPEHLGTQVCSQEHSPGQNSPWPLGWSWQWGVGSNSGLEASASLKIPLWQTQRPWDYSPPCQNPLLPCEKYSACKIPPPGFFLFWRILIIWLIASFIHATNVLLNLMLKGAEDSKELASCSCPKGVTGFNLCVLKY